MEAKIFQGGIIISSGSSYGTRHADHFLETAEDEAILNALNNLKEAV